MSWQRINQGAVNAKVDGGGEWGVALGHVVAGKKRNPNWQQTLKVIDVPTKSSPWDTYSLLSLFPSIVFFLMAKNAAGYLVFCACRWHDARK